MPRIFWAAALSALACGWADDIPPAKLDLIEQAVAAMNLKPKFDDFLDAGVAVEVQRIRNDNPGLPDSTAEEMQNIIQSVYASHLQGDNGLFPQLYAVFDKYLTMDDLQFVIHYHGSDGGQRFAQVIPRILDEDMKIETRWREQLRPAVLQALQDRFGNTGWKIEIP